MYYRQPKYFGEFQCVGGKCLETCCYGWNIDWTKEEIEKVKNSPDISLNFKECVEKSFVPVYDDEKYVVKLDEQGKCPLVTEDGLCRIQKELGAEYLSRTCMTYPRTTVCANDILHRSCYSSCPVIITKLLNDEKSTDLINIPIEPGTIQHVHRNITRDCIKKQPELKYFNETFEFFCELISDKKITVETAIVLGALAAQKLDEIVRLGEHDRIPEALKSFRKQFHNAEQLKAIENIKPNYYLKFGFLSEVLEKSVHDGATMLLHDETGTLNIDLYNKGEDGLREALKGRECFLRNLALNLLLEFSVPFKLEDKTIFENYSLFAVAYGLLKLNLIAVCSTDKGITMRTCGQEFVYYNDDKLIGMTAIICRGICQDRGSAKRIIRLLIDNKFTTPAYIALLVK